MCMALIIRFSKYVSLYERGTKCALVAFRKSASRKSRAGSRDPPATRGITFLVLREELSSMRFVSPR